MSIKRIQNFLEFPELPLPSESQQNNTPALAEQPNDVAVSMEDVNCNWNEVQRMDRISSDSELADSADMPALTDINLQFRKAELTCLVGSVGSGKSALLQAIVGELPVRSGSLRRNYKTLAYAAQDPWIMDGTVKENIVMGIDYDDEWYRRVVHCCSLNIDFKQLRDGDMTIVGDRGVQISGGQRGESIHLWQNGFSVSVLTNETRHYSPDWSCTRPLQGCRHSCSRRPSFSC